MAKRQVTITSSAPCHDEDLERAQTWGEPADLFQHGSHEPETWDGTGGVQRTCETGIAVAMPEREQRAPGEEVGAVPRWAAQSLAMGNPPWAGAVKRGDHELPARPCDADEF